MERVATRQEAMVIEEEAQGGRLVMKGKTIWMEEGLGLRERDGPYRQGHHARRRPGKGLPLKQVEEKRMETVGGDEPPSVTYGSPTHQGKANHWTG